MSAIPVHSYSASLLAVRRRGDRHEVLLLRRKHSLAGEWCQIAGKIEEGEKAWQAALRELGEETGLKPIEFYSADICEQFYEAHRDAIAMVPVFVAFVEPEAPVLLDDEHSAFRWVSFDEAVDMVPFAGQRWVFRHVEREFAERRPSRHLKIDLG